MQQLHNLPDHLYPFQVIFDYNLLKIRIIRFEQNPSLKPSILIRLLRWANVALDGVAATGFRVTDGVVLNDQDTFVPAAGYIAGKEAP